MSAYEDAWESEDYSSPSPESTPGVDTSAELASLQQQLADVEAQIASLS